MKLLIAGAAFFAVLSIYSMHINYDDNSEITQITKYVEMQNFASKPPANPTNDTLSEATTSNQYGKEYKPICFNIINKKSIDSFSHMYTFVSVDRKNYGDCR